MDHDKTEMTSETEEKENSSANGGHSSRLCSEEDEYTGTNPAENDPARILQLSQPFFVADTLEDDESLIIPPTQEDSAPFVIPSTPACANKNDRIPGEVDPNDSSILILEETCVDLEHKNDHNDSSKEDANNISNKTCNESDLTQDLELDATQPIVCSNPVEQEEFNKIPNDTDKKVNDEEDDDWELKFSETQTQELLNFEKDNEKDKDPKSQLPNTSTLSKEPESKEQDEDEDEDDLPATLSIEVPERTDEKDYDSSIKILEPTENVEGMETQSDDEIEPSQSCLSEYKGETISTSYKVQPSVDVCNSTVSIEEIPKPYSETGLDKKGNVKIDGDFDIVSESDKTINLTESEPKNALDVESKDLVEDKSLSIEEIPVEKVKEDKEVEHHQFKDVEENETKEANKPEKKEAEIMQIKGKPLPDNSISSTEFPLKISDSKEVEIVEANGEKIEEMKPDEEGGAEEIEFDADKCTKETKVEKKESKVLNSSEKEMIEVKSDKFNNEESRKADLLNSKETVDGPGEMEVDENRREVIEMNQEEKSPKMHSNEVIESCKDAENKDIDVVNEDKSLKDNDAGFLQKPHQEVSKSIESDEPVRDLESVAVLDSQPNKLADEVIQPSTKQISDEKAETPPTFFVAPRNYGSIRKQKNKTIYHDASALEKSDKKVTMGTYKNAKSLEKFFKSIGITLDNERIEMILSKQNEEIEIRPVFSLANQKITLKEYSIESEHHRRDSGVSPISSSTTTSSTLSSKMSIHSGEMADISSSSSAKSMNSYGIQLESQSINLLSSQDSGSEMFPKTSTQKTQEPTGFSEVFGKKGSIEKSKPGVSPIKSEKGAKRASKQKQSKKNAESSTNEASSSNDPKRKRGRATKRKAAVEDKGEETEESKDSVVEEKPRKATRRKKGATAIPDKKPEDIKIPMEDFEMSAEDDAQEEANFGSILPGVKVMARWKDGYYYSGMVQSQELDGKWAVLFEDGLLRTIAPENLIKIAILPKGTSVMVQSPDDYYDPGIVCGHFREGNKVGYEVELDNGVTRRYSRSSVILSGDQAKLIMSNRPPTTPATMTINLDNIIDGKRKRKSVQSPVSSPVAKKSPRVTRSKNPDSNIDSTAESSAAEVISIKSKDSESEEPVPKKRKTRKVAKRNANSVVDSSNNSKATKVLPQRSAKKLFKDYAFLLTNADRKVVPKPPDASDSENYKEEEDIVPFDKDELCGHIASGGGIVLEKFDDIKKCTRRHIFLLANSYLRTMKYIQCIAAGISCVKHHWVQNCMYKSEVLNLTSYILPAGYSIVSRQVVEWHGKTDTFKGCKIALVSAPESPFVYTWAPVLLAAKADFVQKWSLPSSVSGCSLIVDVLITNNHCPPDIIQSAKRRKIPIVSSEWIIQCLIMGKTLQFDAHPKFKYDYTEI